MFESYHPGSQSIYQLSYPAHSRASTYEFCGHSVGSSWPALI